MPIERRLDLMYQSASEAIEKKYNDIGGRKSFLGLPTGKIENNGVGSYFLDYRGA